MSVQSLPRLFNSFVGKSSSKEKLNVGNGRAVVVNQSKYNSLPMKKGNNMSRPSKFDEAIQKRQRLNRNGSIGHLQFRGIKKEFLEKQTSMILYSMTVGGDGLLQLFLQI